MKLQWLHAHECPIAGWTILEALASGHVDVVKWLQQQGWPLPNSSIETAVMLGHLPVVQYLRQQEQAWGYRSFELAATCGHLDILEWMHEAGCPWDGDLSMCRAAAKSGDIGTIAYTLQHSVGEVSQAELLQSTLNQAGCSKKFEAAQWLRAQGAEWPDHLTSAIKNECWPSDMIAWAKSEGYTSPADW